MKIEIVQIADLYINLNAVEGWYVEPVPYSASEQYLNIFMNSGAVHAIRVVEEDDINRYLEILNKLSVIF